VKVCSGCSSVATRCPPEENLVARDEAVAGRGFRRTGDDEAFDDGEASVSARDLIDREAIWSRSFVWGFSGGLLVG
jgi:hypothetical protein